MAEDYYLVTCPHCDTDKYIFKDAFTPKRKKLVRDILCNNLVCLKSLKGLYPRKFEPVTEVSATDRFEIDRSNLPFFQEENKELKKIFFARVLELADRHGLGLCGFLTVGVQLPPLAQDLLK